MSTLVPPALAVDAVRGFVIIEPRELRVEALVRPEVFQESWGLPDEIDDKERDSALARLSTAMVESIQLEVPPLRLEDADQTMRFVRLVAEKGYVEDERSPIPLNDAVIGVTLSFASSDVDTLELNWGFFAPAQERVVIQITSQGSPGARYANRENTIVKWQTEEAVRASEPVEVPPVVREEGTPSVRLLALAIVLIFTGILIMVRKKRQTPSWAAWLLIVGLVCGGASMRVRTAAVAVPDTARTEEITYALLRNIYRAFEYREESDIYDALEGSISGALLERVYLEIRESLELESAGGPRVRVSEIALREALLDNAATIDETGAWLQADWVTVGEVTHWGHTHERTNRYEARLRLIPAEEQWKIDELELLTEEREQKVSASAVEAD